MNEIATRQIRDAQRVRGFVDVLGTSGQWPSASQAGATVYAVARRRLPLPEGPVTVDSIELTPGGSGQEVLPGDEMVLVLEGEVSFVQSGSDLRLTGGQAGVLLRDRPLQWRAETGAKLIVMRCTAGGGAGAEAPVRIDEHAPLSPSNPPAPEVLIGPTPTCRVHSDYRSQNGEFNCGTWDSTPYQRQLIRFGHYELMWLLAGSVVFADESGREGRFAAGDVVLFEQGGGASWNSREHVKKIYGTFRPAS